MIDVVFRIVQVVLNLLWWVVFIHAIMSWLISFNVINHYNDNVRAIYQALQKIVDPIERPIRRILPDFGPLDLSPLVALLLISIISGIILPYLQSVAHGGSVF
ncbi:MAG: YggT family protein [Sphingomonas sp.]|uniref:YggT family protein n=1 Tax=Sphingomonas sp. TaxID=28214 RepID=UPI00356A643E